MYLNLHNSLYPPSFAVWSEEAGAVRTLYVTCKAGHKSWDGAVSRAEALPVWDARHALEVMQPGLFNIDAVTTATPAVSPYVILFDVLPVSTVDTLHLFVEVNASYDSNEFYTGGINGQPSVVWESAEYTDASGHNVFEDFRIMGHGSVDGKDGKIHPDTSGITTAADLIGRITIDSRR